MGVVGWMIFGQFMLCFNTNCHELSINFRFLIGFLLCFECVFGCLNHLCDGDDGLYGWWFVG